MLIKTTTLTKTKSLHVSKVKN